MYNQTKAFGQLEGEVLWDAMLETDGMITNADDRPGERTRERCGYIAMVLRERGEGGDEMEKERRGTMGSVGRTNVASFEGCGLISTSKLDRTHQDRHKIHYMKRGEKFELNLWSNSGNSSEQVREGGTDEGLADFV